MTEIFFELLSPLPLNREVDGRKVLCLWAEYARELFPERWGQNEPLRNNISPEDLSSVLAKWGFPIFLRRYSKPKLTSAIFCQIGPKRQHSIWSITVQDATYSDRLALESILRISSVELSVDFGFIHQITPLETSRALASGAMTYLDTGRKKKNLFITTHILTKYLPDIYWCTIFGPLYVDMLSRELLLDCPAYRVEELSNGSIAITLTPDIRDAVKSEYEFERVRNDVRSHLSSKNAIFSMYNTDTWKYNAPVFRW